MEALWTLSLQRVRPQVPRVGTRRRGRSLAAAALTVSVLVLGACNRNSSTGPSPVSGNNPTPTTATGAGPQGAGIQELVVTGPAALVQGESAALTATARLSNGTSLVVTSEAVWENSDSARCGLSGSVVVTAMQVGSCDISAVYQAVVGRLRVAVTPNTTAGSPSPGSPPTGSPPTGPPPTAPTVTGLSITGHTSIGDGQTTQLQAVAQYSDGSTQTVTGTASWSSSAPATASVDAGLVVGRSPGTATITATHSGQSAQATVQVSPGAPTLTSLSIGGTLAINVGQTTQLEATAHYSDGSSQNVTATASWTSSAPAGNVAAGLVAGISAGTTAITATYSGQSAQATVQVSAVAPTLTGLSITGSTSVAVAGSTQLQAVAQYSDGSTQTVTLLAIWTSSAPLRATVAAGLVVGGLPGSSTITASYSGFTAQVTVTVS